MNYQIRTTSWQKDAETLGEIRRQVFIQEQSVPEELEWDEFDANAIHYLIELDDRTAIGTARLIDEGSRTARIGRFALLPHWRNVGIGSALLSYLLKDAVVRGFQEIHLSAQVRAIPFYERAGFAPYGEIYMDAGIAHRSMSKKLGD